MPSTILKGLYGSYINGSLAKKTQLNNLILKQREEVAYVRTTLTRRYNSLQRLAATIIAALIATKTSEITTYTTIITSLPVGDIKNDFIEKKTLAEQELFRLRIRERATGGLALIQVKQDLENADAEHAFLGDAEMELANFTTPNP